jgi:hypothetical protein
MLRAYPEDQPDHPPQVEKKTKRVAKTKHVANRKIGKYIHPSDKWIALRTKMREAKLRKEGLVHIMADFLRKILPDYSAERQPKNVEQESDTPVDIPVAGTPKRESTDDDGDAESIYLRELGKTTHFRDKQYGIPKEGNTLMIGNSAVDSDKRGVITVKGKQFKLTRGLWDLLTRNDVDTGTISPNDMQRYKSILKLTSAHLSGYEPEGNKKSRGLKYTKVISNLFPSGTIKHRWDKY